MDKKQFFLKNCNHLDCNRTHEKNLKVLNWMKGLGLVQKRGNLSPNILYVSMSLGCYSLEVLDPGVLSFEESLKLKVRLVLVEKDDLNVDVVPSWVEEVIQEGVNRLVVDVATDHDELAPVRLVIARIPDNDKHKKSRKLLFSVSMHTHQFWLQL